MSAAGLNSRLVCTTVGVRRHLVFYLRFFEQTDNICSSAVCRARHVPPGWLAGAARLSQLPSVPWLFSLGAAARLFTRYSAHPTAATRPTSTLLQSDCLAHLSRYGIFSARPLLSFPVPVASTARLTARASSHRPRQLRTTGTCCSPFSTRREAAYALLTQQLVGQFPTSLRHTPYRAFALDRALPEYRNRLHLIPDLTTLLMNPPLISCRRWHQHDGCASVLLTPLVPD